MTTRLLTAGNVDSVTGPAGPQGDPGPQGIPGPVDLEAAGVFNIRAFGALGDGSGDLLSSVYGSLAAAQADFPGAAALTDSIDDAAFFSAVAAAVAAKTSSTQRTTTVYIPAGHYRSTKEWVAEDDVSIDGDGFESSVLQPLTDFGRDRYALRWSSLKVNRVTVRGIGLSGPDRTSPDMGDVGSEMTGLQIPGGGAICEEVKSEYFRVGAEMCSDHSSVDKCLFQTNYYNLLFGGDLNAEADQHIANSDLANASFASIGISGSNMMGGVTMESVHLGYAPYGIFKETTEPPMSAPTHSVSGAGGTGAPFLAGGSFYYFVAPLYGAFGEGIASVASAVATVAAGGKVTVSWAADPDADGYRLYRWTSAAPSNTAQLDSFTLGAVTSYEDLGGGFTARTRMMANPIAVSGCTFVDAPCEAFGNGYILAPTGTVTNNIWINCSTANAFATDKDIAAETHRAVVECASFDGNRVLGGDLFKAAGTDADGCIILAPPGSLENVFDYTTWTLPTKAIWTLSSGSTIPKLTVRMPNARGRLVTLQSGSVALYELVEMELSNERCRVYQAGSTKPVVGVAAQAWSTTGTTFLMWDEGRLSISTNDATIAAGAWVKPDPANAGKVVAATSATDGPPVGFPYAGPASGRVDTQFRAR